MSLGEQMKCMNMCPIELVSRSRTARAWEMLTLSFRAGRESLQEEVACESGMGEGGSALRHPPKMGSERRSQCRTQAFETRNGQVTGALGWGEGRGGGWRRDPGDSRLLV